MIHSDITQIQRVVAQHFGIASQMLIGPRRFRYYARPRQIAMYLTHVLTGLPTTVIGAQFRRDHSTVHYAIKLIAKLRRENAADGEDDEPIGDAIEAIIRKLK